VGLGVDTAHRVVLFHEVNPDPERIYYAHNTFVQAYLEQGPLGALGMLVLPALVLVGAVLARRYPPSLGRRALLAAGVGLTAALEAHGLTDQVLTTNVGTAVLLLGVVAVLGALGTRAQAALAGWTRRLGLGLATIGVVVSLGLLLIPVARGKALLNVGALQLDQAVLRAAPEVDRQALAEAEATLNMALAQDPGHPAILRDFARARFARYDTAGALDALEQAAGSLRIDTFDMLQIAHLYRDLGFVEEAYGWARRAYETSGRPQPDPVMLVYRQATAKDDFRVRTLAEQGEAAMRARAFDEALSLFEQALAFAPDNPYLQDRVGAAERGVQRQQLSEGRQIP
jgi:tetratricopeptide (TPR) repeat protein